MNLSIDTQEENGYLACSISGAWASDELKDFIDTIHAEVKRRGHSRILADMSRVSGPPPEIDRFAMGKHIAAVLYGIKTAVVYKKVLPDTFFEDTAVNRGAMIRVFPDRHAALQWLLEGLPGPA